MESIFGLPLLFVHLCFAQNPGYTEKYRPLLENPRIQRAVKWVSPQGMTATLSSWSVSQKEVLHDYIGRYEEDREFPLVPLPPWPLSEEMDFKIYVASVVQSLYIEANNVVAWSILDYTDEQLEELLADSHLSYSVYPVFNWNPKAVYDFCLQNGVLGLSQYASIMGFADWCRRHLRHSGGDQTPTNLYGYYPAPLDRILSGFCLDTRYPYTTFGCWCTSAIWKEVMRAINIPVELKTVGFGHPGDNTVYTHSCFTISSVHLGVAHGDDFYNRLLNNLSGGFGHSIPPDSIFVTSGYLVDHILSPSVLDCNDSVCNNKYQQSNFNRYQRTTRLCVQYLTDALLIMRAGDRDSTTYPQYMMDRLSGTEVGGTFVFYAKPYLSDEERTNAWRAVDSCLSALGNGNWKSGASIVNGRQGQKFPALPASIVLAWPPNGTEVNRDTISLRWLRGYEAVTDYWLEVATDPVFAAKSVDSALVDTVFRIGGLPKASCYWWRVRGHNSSGWGPFSGARKFSRTLTSSEVGPIVSMVFSLSQNYPNPFNPSTKIQFTIVNRQWTIVKVFDLLGREVATLVNEMQEPGTHSVEFDGSNLTSGVYFYRMLAGDFTETKRLLLLR